MNFFKRTSIQGKLFVILVLVPLLLLACHNSEGKEKKKPAARGVNPAMQTYYMGRFAIDVPVEMKKENQVQTIRYCQIEEFSWPEGVPRAQARQQIWEKRIKEIKGMRLPEGVNNAIIETQDFGGLGDWAKGIFYYGDPSTNEEGRWDLLLDAGRIGVWIKLGNGYISAKQILTNNITNVAKSYKAVPAKDLESSISKGNWFFTEHGAVNLPYLEQEEVYARFAGHPLDLKLEIETHETQSVEKDGLIDKTRAAIESGYAAGVEIKKIRSHKRTVAGLAGEEQIVTLDDGDGVLLDFGWEYQGKEDSGEHPEIRISMETSPNKLDEKTKIWDAILNSVKPMYKSGK